MTRAKLLVTICQIEWSRSLEYAHQHLHAIGPGIGKQISGMRMGCTKDLHHSGQGGVGSGPHVQRLCCHPHCVNADQRKSSARKREHSEADATGQDTLITRSPRFNSTWTLPQAEAVSSGLFCGRGSSIKAAGEATGSLSETAAVSRSHRCTIL